MPEKDRAAKMEQLIDANLKRAFNDVLKEDVPDRFTNLLAELRAAESKNRSSDNEQSAQVAQAPNVMEDDAPVAQQQAGGVRNGR